MNTKRFLGISTAALLAIVSYNEGYSPVPYRDGAGVLTICYGDTNDVRLGMVLTKEQCDERLVKSIPKYAVVLDKLPDATPDVVALGAVDMSYNIGISAFNKSTLKKCLIKQDYDCAYNATLMWKYITVNGIKYDCSKSNKKCAGMWTRRVWQAQVMGNRFSTIEEALLARDLNHFTEVYKWQN